MHIVLHQLIQDHQNLTKIHACLKREMRYYKDGESRPDVGILLDATDYLRNYPEAFHHPLEDRIYGQMRISVVDPFMLRMLDHIEMQHAQMEVLLRRLHADFVAIANDQVIPVRKVVSDYEAFIDLAEEHISCENKYLFPAITQYLSHDELDAIKEEIDARKDPLFGQDRLKIYENLHRSIMPNKDAVA